MAKNISSLFSSFLLLLFLYLGCFFAFAKSHKHRDRDRHTDVNANHSRVIKRRKITPVSPSTVSSSSSASQTNKCSKSLSFLKHIFSSPSNSCKSIAAVDPAPCSSSQPCVVVAPDPTPSVTTSSNQIHPRSINNSSSDNCSFPLRNDIFPCPSCGEIFNNPSLLEHHKSVKHAVTELTDGDTSKNIVTIIFNTGWNSAGRQNSDPVIDRILKIHNSPRILSKFEEYREIVKSRAAISGAVGRRRDERCIADGNELLRFHCTTFLCDLGHDGNSKICNGQYCSVCGIVRSGFSHKMDGISTLSNSWKAHVAIPEEIEEEFKFMSVKRAMLVCRVIAGRVGSDQDEVEKMDCGFDSVIGGGGGGAGGSHVRDDEDELLVFNPRAVLPCFVIVYKL